MTNAFICRSLCKLFSNDSYENSGKTWIQVVWVYLRDSVMYTSGDWTSWRLNEYMIVSQEIGLWCCWVTRWIRDWDLLCLNGSLIKWIQHNSGSNIELHTFYTFHLFGKSIFVPRNWYSYPSTRRPITSSILKDVTP